MSSSQSSSSVEKCSSVICEEVFDDGYQPSQEEINEYAIKIGIDPEKEPHLLYLAKEGLMQALPKEWQICYNDKVLAYYYYNSITKASQWDHPLDAIYRNLIINARTQLQQISSTTIVSDLSEDASQIDSGIRSLQGNDDLELLTDHIASPTTISQHKMDIISNNKSGKLGNLQPLENISNKRFDVINYSNNNIPQIGLSIKTEDNSSSKIVGYSGQSNGTVDTTTTKTTIATTKGFTLTGTGSMFLKSRKLQPNAEDQLETKNNGNTHPFNAVKGILRDSSLTDVKNRNSTNNNNNNNTNDNKLISELECDERKIVRFNLETNTSPSNDSSPDQYINISSNNEDDDEIDDIVADDDKLDADDVDGDDDDDDDNDDDGWDFSGDDEELIGANSTGVKQVTLQQRPNKLQLKSIDNINMTKSTNRVTTTRKTYEPSSERTNLFKLFDKQLDNKTNSNAIKPLYDKDEIDTTDSDPHPNQEEDAVNVVQDKRLTNQLKLEEEYERNILKTNMQKRLTAYKESLEKQQKLDEINLKEEMVKRLEIIRLKLAEAQRLEIDSTIIEIDEARLDDARQSAEQKLVDEIDKIHREYELKLNIEIDREADNFNRKLLTEQNQLKIDYEKQLEQIIELNSKEFIIKKNDLETKLNKNIDDFKLEMDKNFNDKRNEIVNEHKQFVETLEKNHKEILQDLERDLKTEEELLKKEQLTNLSQLKDKLGHELEVEKQRMRESGEQRMYEKIRCEKRLLEDKYKCLKDKYVRLKTDVKLSLERRNNRKREQQSITTGSETERSNSNKQQSFNGGKITGNNNNNNVTTSGVLEHNPANKPPPSSSVIAKEQSIKLKDHYNRNMDKKFGIATSKYISQIQQQYQDDTTSVSQSDTTISNNYNRSKYLPNRNTNNTPVNITNNNNNMYLSDNGNSDLESFHKNQENNNPIVKENPGRQRKKIFTRLKSASTSRLNTSNNHPNIINNNNNNNNNRDHGGRPCTPVENLRRQLKKLEDLEDQFPDNTLESTYHLRYPFSDIGTRTLNTVTIGDGRGDLLNDNISGNPTSSELEFFKHRIHLERDAVRRAKESLRSQRINFRARQREIKQSHKNSNRHTFDQLVQEEKELTDMEVNLHRTRALLGEKVIRLRHLEQSLNRVCNKDKSIDLFINDTSMIGTMNKKDDTTISDLSSHSSSGFSSNEFGSETHHHGSNRATRKKEMYQESTEIMQSLEHLNAEIREIWEILSKQQSHGLPPPPSFGYQEINWPSTSTLTNSVTHLPPHTTSSSITTNLLQQQQHQSKPIPTLADRLETYRQLAANRTTGSMTTFIPTVAANTIVSQSTNTSGGHTTSLVERTQDLRNWLKQAKNQHELLSNGPPANL